MNSSNSEHCHGESMNRSVNILIVLCILSILPFGNMGMAQASRLSQQNSSGGSPSSFLCVSTPDDLTMSVNLWGYVHSPGRYEISTSADLIQLLSCAGGPLPEASLGEVRISRIGKSELGEVRREITVNLDEPEELHRGNLALHPGDIIHVDRTGWNAFRDVLGVLTTVALLTTAVASVVISSQ